MLEIFGNLKNQVCTVILFGVIDDLYTRRLSEDLEIHGLIERS